MMYTIDKDSSRDCIYVLKKRFIAIQGGAKRPERARGSLKT